MTDLTDEAVRAPHRIWTFEYSNGAIPRSGDWIDEQSECPDGSPEYILATPAALAASPEVAKLIREAEARGVERAASLPCAIIPYSPENKAALDSVAAYREAIRALAPDAGVKDLAALRAERDQRKGQRYIWEEAYHEADNQKAVAEADRDRLTADLAAAQAQIEALQGAATLAMFDLETAFKPGQSGIEQIRLVTGACIRLRTALATLPAKEG